MLEVNHLGLVLVTILLLHVLEVRNFDLLRAAQIIPVPQLRAHLVEVLPLRFINRLVAWKVVHDEPLPARHGQVDVVRPQRKPLAAPRSYTPTSFPPVSRFCKLVEPLGLCLPLLQDHRVRQQRALVDPLALHLRVLPGDVHHVAEINEIALTVDLPAVALAVARARIHHVLAQPGPRARKEHARDAVVLVVLDERLQGLGVAAREGRDARAPELGQDPRAVGDAVPDVLHGRTACAGLQGRMRGGGEIEIVSPRPMQGLVAQRQARVQVGAAADVEHRRAQPLGHEATRALPRALRG
mmetsp:Transcript_104650/g.320583  ORF Transcript_104650/g.320583 Transcript_104650/m.320583 type:complete len:298 (+) Transcript_104650:1293-2186(+)